MMQTGCFGPIRTASIALALALLPWTSAVACTVSSVGSVAFGNYDVFALTSTAGAGSFSVGNCSKNAQNTRSYTAALSTGTSGSFASRSMKSGASVLTYNLYTTLQHATVWGDGTGSTATISNNPASLSTITTHTIYGLIPAGQDVPAGNYSDTITITVSF
jgi:spore coat protein U-like protein